MAKNVIFSDYVKLVQLFNAITYKFELNLSFQNSSSYDEHLCQWDKRSFKLPISKKRFGGGIWRIKQHPRNPEILALACMDNGFKVVDRDDFTEICHYTEHQSLAYGVDWKYCNENVLASCSFYDHYLTCWTFPHKEK